MELNVGFDFGEFDLAEPIANCRFHYVGKFSDGRSSCAAEQDEDYAACAHPAFVGKPVFAND